MSQLNPTNNLNEKSIEDLVELIRNLCIELFETTAEETWYQKIINLGFYTDRQNLDRYLKKKLSGKLKRPKHNSLVRFIKALELAIHFKNKNPVYTSLPESNDKGLVLNSSNQVVELLRNLNAINILRIRDMIYIENLAIKNKDSISQSDNLQVVRNCINGSIKIMKSNRRSLQAFLITDDMRLGDFIEIQFPSEKLFNLEPKDFLKPELPDSATLFEKTLKNLLPSIFDTNITFPQITKVTENEIYTSQNKQEKAFLQVYERFVNSQDYVQDAE